MIMIWLLAEELLFLLEPLKYLHSGPDDTNQSISISIDDDDLYEGGSSGAAETVEFSLGNFVNSATATNSTLTYSIVDDEDPPTIEFDVANSVTSGAETSANPTITVKTNRRSILIQKLIILLQQKLVPQL